MRALVVHCEECGATKKFRGEDTNEIMDNIDASDWTDSYNPDKWVKFPLGHITGFCPEHANKEGE